MQHQERPSPPRQLVTFIYVSDLLKLLIFMNVLGLELVLDQGSCRIYDKQQCFYLFAQAVIRTLRVSF